MHRSAGWSWSLGYTIGFVVVVLGRQQLFTENTLSPILPLLHHRDRKTLINVGRLWALVLVANIAGTWAFSLALTHLDGVEPRTWDAFVEIGRRTVDKSFSSTFFHAVVAGWLIALMMWLLPAVKSSRLHIIVVMTYIIALGEFSHIVAGSVDCAFLVLIGKASLGEYFAVFFAPTLLGNVVGGTLLVALLNYGQVATEISPSSDRYNKRSIRNVEAAFSFRDGSGTCPGTFDHTVTSDFLRRYP